MSGLELPTTTSAPWVVWTPLTTGELLTVMLGVVALTLAACGLWSMRTASNMRNRQLDAQSDTLAAVARGIETMIERTAPGAGGETA